MGFIEELVDELREVFSIDKDFSEKKFEKQMAVVRGQALNLASAMRFGPIQALDSLLCLGCMAFIPHFFDLLYLEIANLQHNWSK